MKRVPELTDHLGYWLRQLSNHVSRSFAQKLEEKGVTVAEWAMMRSIYEQEPMLPSRIAEHMGMTRGAISKLADRLIAKGLLLRTASEQDRRAQTLALTADALALVPELAALAEQNEMECFGHLTTQERWALRSILQNSITLLGITEVAVD